MIKQEIIKFSKISLALSKMDSISTIPDAKIYDYLIQKITIDKGRKISKKELNYYLQYKIDFFHKINFLFKKRKKVLDVGCGDGLGGLALIKKYNLNYYGTDIYRHNNIKELGIKFRQGNICAIPYPNNFFDYVFVSDVLHHIDESKNKKPDLKKALQELKRVCKRKGYIIICEGNRYNPLLYPHLVRYEGHNCFDQSFFQNTIKENYHFDNISFSSFESHFTSPNLIKIYKLFELFMERFLPKKFLAYNVAIIKK